MNKISSKIEDIAYKANLWLQILLQLNVYISSAWAVIYGFHILYNMSQLKDFHGIFVIIGYIVAVSVESWRLFAGYSGNLRARAGDLSTFLILSPLIQLPIILFLLLSAKSQRLLITAASSSIFICMALEFFVGIYTWRQMCYHQTELYKLKRQIYLQQQTAEKCNDKGALK